MALQMNDENKYITYKILLSLVNWKIMTFFAFNNGGSNQGNVTTIRNITYCPFHLNLLVVLEIQEDGQRKAMCILWKAAQFNPIIVKNVTIYISLLKIQIFVTKRSRVQTW